LHINSGESEEAEFLLGQTLRTLEAQCGPHDPRTIGCAEKLATLTQVRISGGDQVWGLVPRPSEECLSVGSCTPVRAADLEDELAAADLEDELAAWDSAVEATNCYGTKGHAPSLEASKPESNQAKASFQACASENCNGNDCCVKPEDGHGSQLVSTVPEGSAYSLPDGSDLGSLSNLTTRPQKKVNFQALADAELRACSWSPRRHSPWHHGIEMSQELPQAVVEFGSGTGNSGGIPRSISM